MSQITLKITGMSCEHCVKAVTGALTSLDGVEGAQVSLEQGSAVVDYDPGKVSPEAMMASVAEEGYEASA